MKRRQNLTQAILLLVLLATGFSSSMAAIAQDGDRITVSRTLVPGNDYDISIGKAGVFISGNLMEGTAVLSREESPKHHPLIIWKQRMLEFHVYRGAEGSNEYEYLRGLGYVYFNLDLQTRRAWEGDKKGQMSIWWRDEFNSRWVKCPTFLQRDASAPQGRLVCYLEEFGTYGLGIRQEDLIIKLIKLGLVTLTPTPKP